MPADSASEIVKFTISIPRESCTSAKAKYSSSVVPPDLSVHFYHCPCAIAADTEDSLFIKILHCDYHILQSYLSDRPEVLYNLGNRHHNKTLIHKTVD